jgi:Pyruvate phosphate dikinase, AMP/ATP-binding domain
VVGSTHGERFYPDVSGVVRSRNFYPIAPAASEDGIATVALGLGRAVVDGGKCLMFSPRYPQNLVQFSSVHDMLTNSQSEFWAIDVSEQATDGASARERKFTLPDAEKDGTLHAVASTYSPDNDAIYDGMSRAGARVVSFAPILKYGRFPLAPVLETLMKVGEQGLARPVEIEFAVRLSRAQGEAAEFAFLQMRPLVLSRETEELKFDEVDPALVLCRSSNVLGNGRISDIRDVVMVDFHRFERAKSFEVAETVSYFNSKLNQEGRPYLLIGVGRWGSNDPWLGIPVEWDQVSGARVIIEAGFRDFRVTPSQGSHFFQNLTAFQVGYFTVNPDAGEGFVDWEWLGEQTPVEERDCVRHLRFETPLEVVMNGRANAGVVVKGAQ